MKKYLGFLFSVFILLEATEVVADESFSAAICSSQDKKPSRAVCVVLAGANGDSTVYFKDARWTEFARTNGIALVAATFTSPVGELKSGRGYYDARVKSGRQLVDYLDRQNLGGLPLFVYGFSGGAHFTASFAEHFPSHVTAWCAASAGWWQDLAQGGDERPPGIVACGTEDFRYGACLSHFHDGRAVGRRWTWVDVPGLGHSRSEALEVFVQAYFIEILKQRGRCRADGGVCLDSVTGNRRERASKTADVNLSWLPSKALLPRWQGLTGRGGVEILRRSVKAQPTAQPVLTVFLRTRKNVTPRGVLCLSLLANHPDDIPAKIVSGNVASDVGRMVAFAESNKLAVVAWGAARHLWNPRKNWTELTRQEARAADHVFDQVSEAWAKCVGGFIRERRIPDARFLLWGCSGAAQYAQRLALRKPERFLAVHVHIPSSFDEPTDAGASVLWCLTTGENESGYERSLAFFKAAKEKGYPILYRAYPGLGHAGCGAAERLGRAILQMALDRARRSDEVDWSKVFDASPMVGDVVNLRCVVRAQGDEIPDAYRVVLPSNPIAELWKAE